MSTIVDLLLITFIVVNLIDISGFVNSVKHGIGRLLNVSPDRIRIKPFDCSYCMNWWTCLIYLFITDNIELHYLLIALFLSFCAPVVRDVVYLSKDFFGGIVRQLYKLVDIMNR